MIGQGNRMGMGVPFPLHGGGIPVGGGVGAADLNPPLPSVGISGGGGGGGGSLVGPDHPIFSGRYPQGRGGAVGGGPRPPSVPPGARFDPFGPGVPGFGGGNAGGFGRGGQGNRDFGDLMPPPGPRGPNLFGSGGRNSGRGGAHGTGRGGFGGGGGFGTYF